MKKIFKKAMTVLGSAAMIGATVGSAFAAAYPSPFTSNSAIVIGTGAGASDQAAITNLDSSLTAFYASDAATSSFEGGKGVTELEVPLGSVLNFTGSDITTALTDSKIDGLLDSKINWDDGGASGADDYNVHEEIRVGGMTVKTTLDYNDFEEFAALDNDRQLEYRYVFDDAFNVSGVGSTEADDLYLTILGKTYEISAMSNTSITVVTSEETTLHPGDSVTVEGKTFTLEDLSATAARVNGETVTTSAKKIDGIKVRVKSGSIFYNENFPEQGSVVLQIGEEISKTYSDGEEYIGEDDADPQWVWTISNPSVANGYIGVKYNYKETDEEDDVAYVGGNSYILPENFGAVSLDSLTEVDYEDFKVYFDQIDLYNSTTTSSTETIDSAYVLVIEASDGTEDAITTTTGGHETNKIYLRLVPYTGTATEGTFGAAGDFNNSVVELFYSDVNGEVTDAIRPRYVEAYETATNNTISSAADIADIIVGDTTISVTATMDTGALALNFTDNGAAQSFWVDAGGVDLTASAGDLKWFGDNTEGDSMETAESTDLVVSGTNIGTYDNDVLTYHGIIIEEPKNNLESDEVIFSVPSDRVYAQASVKVDGTVSESTPDTGIMTVNDNEVSSKAAGMNLIVVGGSAINSVAADLLGVSYPTSGSDFTTATGIAAGEALIQSFSKDGKTALLVAGYNQADTAKAVTHLIEDKLETKVGTKLKVTSATEGSSAVTAM